MKSPSRRVLWLQKLADEVAHGIDSQVRSGALKTGDTLPTREELAGRFVTTIGVVDRAIDSLVEEGVLAEEEGAYTVVGYPAPERPFAVPEAGDARLDDVLAAIELRIGVEAEAAALAATRATDAERTAIHEAARAFDGATEATGQADFAFHRAIAEASNNPYMLELVETLGPLLFPRLRVPLRDPAASHRRAADEHAEIVRAIDARDAAAARAAMHAHLSRVRDQVQNAPA